MDIGDLPPKIARGVLGDDFLNVLCLSLLLVLHLDTIISPKVRTGAAMIPEPTITKGSSRVL